MTRSVVVLLGLSLLAPAPAAAAPFGEPSLLPVVDTPGCVQATGAPGELVRAAGGHIEFLRASPAGLTVVRSMATDDLDSSFCPPIAAKPGGAGVMALTAGERVGPIPVRVRLREPGEDWGPAVAPLPADDGFSVAAPAVAVAERGDAVVAAYRLASSSSMAELLVTKREPGRPFGSPQELASADAPKAVNFITPRAGMSATGEAIVAWALQRGGTRELWAAVAPPGAPFGAPQRVSDALDGARFELDVAPDGRALLAFVSRESPAVAERAPGAAFGAPQVVGGLDGVIAHVPAVALRADGGAVVAFTEVFGGPVAAAVRDRPGGFGPLTPVPGSTSSVFGLLDPLFAGINRYTVENFGPVPLTSFGGDWNVQAAITGDGRALLTWGSDEADLFVVGLTPRSATLPLSGGTVETRRHGANVLGSGWMTPAVLADGGAAVAWSDPGRGRVHLAVEGAAHGADPPVPRVRFGAPVRRTVPDGDPLELPFTCSAACDVRAEIAGSHAIGAAATSRADSGRLWIQPLVRPIGRLRGGPVRVVVRFSAPGARHAVERTVTVDVRRKRLAPVRVLGLTARRRGSSVVVRFRTNRPASGNVLTVVGLASRDERATPVTVGNVGSVVKERRYRVQLPDAADARWIVVAEGRLTSRMRRTWVRVRG